MGIEFFIILFCYWFIVEEISIDDLSFISDMSNLCLLYFSLTIVRCKSMLLIFWENHFFLLMQTSAIVSLLQFHFIDSCSNFYFLISILLLALGLYGFSFSIFLRWKLRLLILDFFFFLIRTVHWMLWLCCSPWILMSYFYFHLVEVF